MLRRLKIPTLFLAAALQALPMLRNALPLAAQGCVPSVWAIILRLGATAAALEAYDTVSGATALTPYFDCPTAVTGYVAVPFVFKATLTNLIKTDVGAFFASSTPSAIPTGVTMTTVDISPYTYGNVYGLFSGKPTSLVSATNVNVTAGFPNETPVSTNIAFTILPTPVPLPASNNAAAGSNVTFTITAGPLPLAYQWRLNQTNLLVGATNSSLTLANVQYTNAGSYTVVITNTAGAFTSAPAVLTVLSPPVITFAPTNITAVAGKPVVFCVNAAGSGPLDYHWHKNGTNLPGATTTNLSIAAVRLADAGNFAAVVTNAYGSVTSAVATLTVNNPPPPIIAPPEKQSGQFVFSFSPAVGLTNTILTNATLVGGTWNVLTNFPPPASSNSLSVTDAVSGTGRFYRVQIVP